MSDARPGPSLSLLVSLPPSELPVGDLPGSVFSRKSLPANALTPELGEAIDLLEYEAELCGMTTVYVARPEIFVHGAALDWLKGKIGAASDHIGLSDGTSVRLLPGLRNHVFLFGRERSADATALAQLQRRAPELLTRLDGQINTALSFAWRGRRYCPPPIALPGPGRRPAPEPALFRLLVHPHVGDGGLAHMLALGPARPVEAPFARLTYVPLTEASLDSADFVNALAERLAASLFDPARGWILRPPARAAGSVELKARWEAVLRALAGASATLPPVALDTVLLTAGDLDAGRLAEFGVELSLFAHESCELWRLGRDFFRPSHRSRSVRLRDSASPPLSPS